MPNIDTKQQKKTQKKKLKPIQQSKANKVKKEHRKKCELHSFIQIYTSAWVVEAKECIVMLDL